MKILFDVERNFVRRACVSIEAESEAMAEEAIRTVFVHDWPASIRVRLHTSEGVFEPKTSDELVALYRLHAPCSEIFNAYQCYIEDRVTN